MQTTRFYDEIIRETRLAVCLKIHASDERGVWFPKSLISINSHNQTVTVSENIWYQKKRENQNGRI